MEETKKRRKVCAAAESVNLSIKKEASPPIDEDALTEILVRLPPKSVIRFKSVCKSWLSLLSSEHFRRLHALCKRPISLIILTPFKRHSRSPKQIIKTTELFYDNSNQMIIEKKIEKQRIIPFNSVCYENCVDVLSCCWNGLLLLRNRNGEFHVYNPTTNQSQTIPLPFKYNNSAGTLHLVFDPSKSLHYKIVYIREDRPQIKSFDSESQTWSVCVEGFNFSRGRCCLFYLIHGGLLYCFNFVKNQFTAVCPLPKLANKAIAVDGNTLLESTNGCVYYCALVMELDSIEFTTGAALWELQVNGDEDNPKWLLKYHHRIPRLRRPFFKEMLAFVLETSTVLVNVFGSGIIMYSFLDKTCKTIPLYDLYYYVHAGQTLPSF